MVGTRVSDDEDSRTLPKLVGLFFRFFKFSNCLFSLLGVPVGCGLAQQIKGYFASNSPSETLFGLNRYTQNAYR